MRRPPDSPGRRRTAEAPPPHPRPSQQWSRRTAGSPVDRSPGGMPHRCRGAKQTAPCTPGTGVALLRTSDRRWSRIEVGHKVLLAAQYQPAPIYGLDACSAIVQIRSAKSYNGPGRRTIKQGEFRPSSCLLYVVMNATRSVSTIRPRCGKLYKFKVTPDRPAALLAR